MTNHTILLLIFKISCIKTYAEEEHCVQWVLMIMTICRDLSPMKPLHLKTSFSEHWNKKRKWIALSCSVCWKKIWCLRSIFLLSKMSLNTLYSTMPIDKSFHYPQLSTHMLLELPRKQRMSLLISLVPIWQNVKLFCKFCQPSSQSIARVKTTSSASSQSK